MSNEDAPPAEVRPPPGQSILIATNPHSGGPRRQGLIEECAQAIRNKGFTAIVETSIEAICDHAAELRKAGELRAVVSAGGDGTLALWANKLPSDVPICVFPLGTENIVARYVGYKASPAFVAEVIAQGREERWDVGIANGRSFMAICGVGFDAEVVRRLHAGRRGHISYFTYAAPILRALATYRFPAIHVTCWEGERRDAIQFTAKWAFIANLARYALRLDICPRAKTNDGFLDGAFFSHSGLLSGLRYLWKIKRGSHVADPSVSLAKGVRFRLESDRPVPYQLDGDPGGMLPLDITVSPGRLRLLVPQSAPPKIG